MSKKLKIVIISSSIILVAVFMILFFVFAKPETENSALPQKEKTEWVDLKKEELDDFIYGNFSSELAQKIDKESFLLYSADYAKDKNGVYVRYFCNEIASFVQIQNADQKSFEVLDYCYSKDKKNVYFANIVIAGAEVGTFAVLDKNYSHDKKNVYFQERVISGADNGSFEIISNSEERGFFSRDKKYFYQKHLRVSHLDPDNFNPVKAGYIKKGLFDCLGDKIDRDSFDVLGDNFAKDKNNVYAFSKIGEALFLCNRIEGADPSSFRVISGLLSKDSAGDFYGSKRISEEADTEQESAGGNFAKDDNKVYYQETEIPGADPETFEVISDNYGQDNNNVYFGGETIPGADPETFEVIVDEDGEHYATDQENVYDETKIIEDAEAETFDPEDYAGGNENDSPAVNNGENNETDGGSTVFIIPDNENPENCYFIKNNDSPYVERRCREE